MNKKPKIAHTILDLPRALKSYYNFLEVRNEKSQIGNEQVVIVIPGFLSGDWATAPLRRFLSNQGFIVHGWGQGTNLGFSFKKIKQLVSLINKLHRIHNKPVILIGWSLGGIYAREISRYVPNVSKVVTLASPFANVFANYLTDVYIYFQKDKHPSLHQLAEMIKHPLSIPSLNIYTKRDGIVHWSSCFLNDDKATIIEVESSHTGMGYDPEVFDIIVDFLKQTS